MFEENVSITVYLNIYPSNITEQQVFAGISQTFLTTVPYIILKLNLIF